MLKCKLVGIDVVVKLFNVVLAFKAKASNTAFFVRARKHRRVRYDDDDDE